MPASKPFLPPETIKRIGRLDLRARYIVEGLLAGMHRSPYFGQSVEFVQHRQYAWGDDLRYLDWKVWGRQDRLYVKQFEEDTNLRCLLLVDVSASMRYGSGPLSKHQYAATLAACLAYLVLRQQDAVGCITFDAGMRLAVPQKTHRRHLDSIVQALETSGPDGQTDLLPIARHAAENFPRRGLVALFSDLLFPREPLFRALRLLRSRGHDLIVFHVLDDDELNFPFEGATQFQGLESPDQIRCNPRALREGYLQALNAFLEEVQRSCSREKSEYVLVRTSQPVEAALITVLTRRLARYRRK